MRIRPLGRVDTTTSLTTLTYIGLQLDPLDTIHATDEQQHSQHREAALTAEEVVEPRYVHPDSRRIYEAYGGKFAWTRYIPMFGAAIETFGPRLVFALNYTEFVSKGLGNYFLQSTFTPMFLSHFGCTAMQFQRYKNVATMGWSVKPFMALISDSFALFGYTKRWYMVISELGAAVCCIIYGLLPGGQSNAQTAAILTFIAGLGMANVDILTEGLYSREMRRHPAAGPQLVSSIWWMITLAQLITSFVEGPLANVGLEAIGAYIACGCLLLTIPVLAINWYGEKTNREERLYDLLKLREEERAEAQLKGVDAAHDELDVLAAKKNDELQHQPSSSFHVGEGTDELVGFSNEPYHNTSSPDDMEEDLDIPSCCFGIIEFNQEVLIRNWPITIYCILMCAGVIATAIVTVGGNQWALLAVCSSVSVVLGAMGFWALPLVIAKVNLFAFLNSALGVSVSGALTTWYLSGPDCVPGGPDFSYFFYMTTSSCISSAFSMVGVAAFSYIFSKRSYQLTFVVTSILGQLSSIFDLMIVERWNKDIGIPDKYVFICGDAMIGGVISMLSWMPMVVLLSQLCPRGSESIVYSLLAGYSNLGQTMATEAGTLIMEFLWSVQSEPPCDWSNLPKLLILTSFIIPLLSYPPIFLLVPRARICDEIDTDGNVIGVKGSNERAHDRAPTSTIEDESGEVEQKGAVALEDDAEVGDERISS